MASKMKKQSDRLKIEVTSVIGASNLWFVLAQHLYSGYPQEINLHSNSVLHIPSEVREYITHSDISLYVKRVKLRDMFKEQIKLPTTMKIADERVENEKVEEE